MRRTVSTDRQIDKFGVGKDGFRLGNQAGGVDATVVSEEDMDGPQEEIVTTIEQAGLTPASVEGNAPQLPDAIPRLMGRLFRGIRTGLFVRTSNAQITLSPVSGDKVSVEIDGILRDASSLVWDNTTDLDTGSVAQNTIYYLYALVTSGALDTKISTTAPSTTGKVGYHPTRTSERCIFAMRTKVGSAVWEDFDELPDGWTILRRSYGIQDLGNPDGLTTYKSPATAITGAPATARALRVNIQLMQDNLRVYYAHESFAGLSVASNPSALVAQAGQDGSDDSVRTAFTFDLPVDSTPAITFGIDTSPNGYVHHDLRVMGWRNAL